MKIIFISNLLYTVILLFIKFIDILCNLISIYRSVKLFIATYGIPVPHKTYSRNGKFQTFHTDMPMKISSYSQIKMLSSFESSYSA